MIRLELDGIPPTLNEWARTHWTKQREKKIEWEWTVLAAALKAKTGRPGYQEARIHITYHFKQKRRRDTDNYAPKFLLDALVKAPAGLARPERYREGGYIRRLPADPWGNAYQYRQPGQHGRVDVFSMGADGREGGEGENADIGNWQ